MNFKIYLIFFTLTAGAPAVLERSGRYASSQWRSLRGKAIHHRALKLYLTRMQQNKSLVRTKKTPAYQLIGNPMSGFQIRKQNRH